MSHDVHELLTVAEVAILLRVSRRTVTRWLSAGVLPSTKVGGRRLIARSALQDMLSQDQPAGDEHKSNP